MEFIRVENGITQQKCIKCGEWKDLNETNFYKVNKNSEKLVAECKECRKKKQKAYKKEHRDKYLEYDQNWRDNHKPHVKVYDQGYYSDNRENRRSNYNRFVKNNPDKVREYGEKRKLKNHKISEQQWIANKDFFKNENGEWCCVYCGMTESEHKRLYGQQLHKEHVQHDGANDISNCVPSCRICNSKKHKDSLEKWYNENNPIYNKYNYDRIIQWITYEFKKYVKVQKIAV